MNLLILMPRDDRFGRDLSLWLNRLAEPLKAAGVAAIGRPWADRDVDLATFDAVSPLLAWGYHFDPDGFSARTREIEAAGLPLINPGAVVRWNLAKTYLTELAAKGAPVVETVFADKVTQAVIEEARRTLGAATVVAKPQISGGSHETVALNPGDPLDGAPSGPAMIQAFLPAVAEEGELSLFYFGGRFSHAVAKIAAAGDFRVQPQYGGLSKAIEPPREAFEAAEAVLAASPGKLAYARIDLIRTLDGRLKLMELEVIEPDLFLQHAPDHGAMFARAVADAL